MISIFHGPDKGQRPLSRQVFRLFQHLLLASAGLVWSAVASGGAAEIGEEPREVPGQIEGSVERAPCAEYTEERRAFFGDLHVHTAFSLDASTMGTRTAPADSYSMRVVNRCAASNSIAPSTLPP